MFSIKSVLMGGVILASNGDLITAFGNDTSAAAEHFINSGYSESRSTDSFDEWVI